MVDSDGSSSRRSSQLSGSGSDRTVRNTYFTTVLNKAGFTVKYGEEPNIILRERALVIRDIKNELERGTSSENVQNFIRGLKKVINIPKGFKRALSPSEMIDENSGAGIKQDSLFHMLVRVDCLQKEVIAIIIEALVSCTYKDGDLTVLRPLLNCLKYLPYIQDPAKLTEDLIVILQTATQPAQEEILSCIVEIIPDSQHDEVAKNLSPLLEKPELFGAVIACYNDLTFSEATRNKVVDQVLSVLQFGSSFATLPILLRFLLIDCKPHDMANVLSRVRRALDKLMNENKTCESLSDLGKCFHEIAMLVNMTRGFADAWITLVNGFRSKTDYKPVDFVMLFLIHSNRIINKKSIIEGMFKKKVKSGLFQTSLLEDTIKNHLDAEMFNTYFMSIIDIARILLKGLPDALSIEYASCCYQCIFAHPFMTVFERREILDRLRALLMREKRTQQAALDILTSLAENNKDLMKTHANQLMGLLIILNRFSLVGVKQIFDLLCGLIYTDEFTSLLDNDIGILVQKKQRSAHGIIAAVSVVKHAVKEGSNSTDSEVSYSSITDIPSGIVREAAFLLRTTSQNVSDNPELLALYYDQLASMVNTTPNIDKTFLVWLVDEVTNDFQNMFVTEAVPEPVDDIYLSMQYNLNSQDVNESNIAINIAEMVLNPETEKSMLLLSPLFRLVRSVHNVHNAGALDPINALLGCAIVMPIIDPDNGLEAFDITQTRKIIDCTFHCINWFRETISAFIMQKNKMLRKKLVQRLGQLVKLEAEFYTYMENVPDHKLPHSYFPIDSGDASKSPAKPPDRKRKRTPLDTTTVKTQETQPAKASKGRKPQAHKAIIVNFRELDVGVSLTLVKDSSDNKDCTAGPELKYLLTDIVNKLNKITVKSDTTILTNLNSVKPADIIADCVAVMSNIRQYLSNIVCSVEQLLERSHGIHDVVENFQPEALETKDCFRLTLEFVALVLGWIGFQSTKNANLLQDCLKALIPNGASQVGTLRQLVAKFGGSMVEYAELCLQLPAAVSLVKIMKTLCTFSTDPDVKRKLVSISGSLLKTRWFNDKGSPETGAQFYVNIDILVKAYFTGIKLDMVSEIVEWVQTDITSLTSKNDTLRKLSAIDRASFPLFYRALCSAFLESLTAELNGRTNVEHLRLWYMAVVTMRGLANIAKTFENKAVLNAFMKRSLGILRLFISQGVPIFEIMLSSKPDTVVEILKISQLSTRFLNNICCHSKYTKDSALMASVPQVRQVLDTLIYRVKAALVANDCSSVFWLGALKNRDLYGESIASEGSESTTTNSNEQSDDELPAEDSDEESVETRSIESDHGSHTSASECF